MARKKIDAQYLLEHPFPISVVSGLANGLIYKLRGKKVPLKTATTLAAVQGFGEAILVMYEKPEERGPVLKEMSLFSISVWSALGSLIGLAPFLETEPESAAVKPALPAAEPLPALPAAEPLPALPNPPAVAGFGSHASRSRRRK